MKEKKVVLSFALLLLFACLTMAQDAVADNMLIYQRSAGGWPKHIDNIRIDYTKKLSAAERAGVVGDSSRNDATIDNEATTKEIRHLLKAHKETGNKKYLAAAEKGIRYLLQMQHSNGGFPQYYPDSSSYRSQVTFNDNAMVNALNILWDVVHRSPGFDAISPSLKQPAQRAIDKGIHCILKTQIVVKGKPTGWCPQYDKKTLQPARARSYELPSISSMETVGIVRFLMQVEQPSNEIKNAIINAVRWLQLSQIAGYKYKEVEDAKQPKGKDRILVADAKSVIWARFYDIDSNKPFFCGRDGVKKWSVAEIEQERRIGYAWYGVWPKSLLEEDFPKWADKKAVACK